MVDFDWLAFMQNWRKELIVSDAYPYTYDYKDSTELVDRNWMGYEGATTHAINATEERLGVLLPTSYKQFLLASNGWRDTSIFVDKLWSVEEVEWFAILNKEWLDSWLQDKANYPQYSDEEYLNNPNAFRPEYLATALQISEVGMGLFLLNPKIINKEGEWETWFFVDLSSAPIRSPSFQDHMWFAYDVEMFGS